MQLHLFVCLFVRCLASRCSGGGVGLAIDRSRVTSILLLLHFQVTDVNSALHPSEVSKSSTSFGWGEGGNITFAGFDPTWQMISCSGETKVLLTARPRPMLYLFLFVKGNRLELSTPNSVDQFMVGPRRALTLRSKGQRSRSRSNFLFALWRCRCGSHTSIRPLSVSYHLRSCIQNYKCAGFIANLLIYFQ